MIVLQKYNKDIISKALFLIDNAYEPFFSLKIKDVHNIRQNTQYPVNIRRYTEMSSKRVSSVAMYSGNYLKLFKKNNANSWEYIELYIHYTF